MHILTAGSASPRRAADLIGPGLMSILEEAAAEHDLVMVDAPPLLGFPEPLQMPASLDGVVAAKAGQASRKAVANVRALFRRPRANVLGLVLKSAPRFAPESSLSQRLCPLHPVARVRRNRKRRALSNRP